jgi:hypothetical protein
MERLEQITLNRDKYHQDKLNNITPDGPAVNRHKPSVKAPNLTTVTGSNPKRNKCMETFKTTLKRDKDHREKFDNLSSVGPAVNRHKLFVKGINLAPPTGSYSKRNKIVLTRLKNAMLLEDPSYRTKLDVTSITLSHFENGLALVFDNISACRLFESKFKSIDFINGSNKNLWRAASNGEPITVSLFGVSRKHGKNNQPKSPSGAGLPPYSGASEQNSQSLREARKGTSVHTD